jgi:hypothetical protein
MTPIQIVMIALLIVLVYLIYTYTIGGSSNKLTGLLPANALYTVSYDTISRIAGNNDIYNYTISLWIYIESWEITASNKPVLYVKNVGVATADANPGNALEMSLGGTDNKLLVTQDQTVAPTPAADGFSLMNPLTPAPLEGMVSMTTLKKKHPIETMDNLSGSSCRDGFYGKIAPRSIVKKSEGKHILEGYDNVTSVVPTMPIQSWTNIALDVNGRAIDIYINGKMIQSSLLPYVPKPLKSDILLTPEPGFSGWTSNLQFYPYSLGPKEIENIYKRGYTGSAESLLSLLGRYSMKIVFVDNTQTPK